MSATRVVGAVLGPDGVPVPGWVLVEGDTIRAVGHGAVTEERRDEDRAVFDGLLLPGLVDLHCHGGGGATFSDPDPERVAVALDLHRRHGTTTLWASLVTAPADDLLRSVGALARFVADGELAGIHLEGPFLSPLRRGAQNPDHLLLPDRRVLGALLTAGGGAVTMVTIAPELPGALALIADVVAAGAIAAVGHSDASYDQTRAAVDAGARVGTHLYNGMRTPHHRDPGPVVALLESPGVACELIADGHHLHPAVLALAAACAGPGRAVLVTDAMAAAGMADGHYVLGGLAVEVAGGCARLADGDSLAGSTITAADGLRYAVQQAGIPLGRACEMAAETPGRLAGRGGRLAPGERADLLVCRPDLSVAAVMAAGRWR